MKWYLVQDMNNVYTKWKIVEGIEKKKKYSVERTTTETIQGTVVFFAFALHLDPFQTYQLSAFRRLSHTAKYNLVFLWQHESLTVLMMRHNYIT